MAEVVSSSPCTLGKRGGDVLSPHHHQICGQLDFSSKKRRLVCGSHVGESICTYPTGRRCATEAHLTQSPIHTAKRARASSPGPTSGSGSFDGRDLPAFTHRQFEAFAREKDVELVAARREARDPSSRVGAMRDHLGEKEGELQKLRNENTRLGGGLGACQKEVERLQGENRILKRGMTIQNNKCRETEGQLHALQQAALQAAEYMKRLEQTNYALSVRVQAIGNSGANDFMGGQRPPDVF
ncbi:unnamed protein product [Choristocarpus tenellus]